jgi:hypothetical protein
MSKFTFTSSDKKGRIIRSKSKPTVGRERQWCSEFTIITGRSERDRLLKRLHVDQRIFLG